MTDYEAETSGALASSWGETLGGQSDELRNGRNGPTARHLSASRSALAAIRWVGDLEGEVQRIADVSAIFIEA
ncbi:hypothetical protein NKH85_32885 [Mesorhizobium sp. M0924]|uniref:hypothetical protein n=1 Tax=unclassified Mesorhizobium TaxID=325217 RepID=UPI0003CEFFF2|nr:hypothetical protein [Mesorhizobium sp. LSHC422A00]ESX58352.1 hypothetical protein X760_19490 [Mesorhizobium sp. LSHC422A00]